MQFALAVLTALLTTGLTADQILDRVLREENTREHYIYREHAEHRRSDASLNFTRDSERIYLEHQPYRRLVAIDRKPLTGKQDPKNNAAFK